MLRFLLCLLLAHAAFALECDLLIVGGNESACAAAVQASRLGVKRIVMVNDIDWLGGQFCSEGIGVVDEWTTVNGKRARFPRSGLFLEVANAIEAVNQRKYGRIDPGNSFCGWLTIEPRDGEKIFEDLLAKEKVQIERGWEPVEVKRDGKRVIGVVFTRGAERLEVDARMTIDASDWGDVNRLSGAAWSAGPDAKSRFGEPSASEVIDETNRREMNPITYCVTLRGREGEGIIPAPEGYEERNHLGATAAGAKEFAALGWAKGTLQMKTAAFIDTTHPGGPYSPTVNVYTHRRLVDALHNGWPFTQEKTFLNWPTQDYPLDVWPKPVADALDATEPGASRKNLVALTPAQRRIVFADAKRHALGLLHYLQKTDEHFRRLELTDEFGTPDRLPPKVYVREGLRLEALTMVREQDLRTPHEEPKWAKVMPADGVFGFQFNIDFHPTRRVFLKDDPAGPWATIHTATRNWSTHTDRSMFPLRGLVPVELDGLIGSSKNIGVSSVVQSALRLHGQMMLCGQASATVAWIALREGIEPRAVAIDTVRVREVQRAMLRSGVLLWPFHDVPVGAPYFEAVNMLAVLGIWPQPEGIFFHPDKPPTDAERTELLKRVPPATKLPDLAPTLTRAELALAVWQAVAGK